MLPDSGGANTALKRGNTQQMTPIHHAQPTGRHSHVCQMKTPPALSVCVCRARDTLSSHIINHGQRRCAEGITEEPEAFYHGGLVRQAQNIAHASRSRPPLTPAHPRIISSRLINFDRNVSQRNPTHGGGSIVALCLLKHESRIDSLLPVEGGRVVSTRQCYTTGTTVCGR